MADATEPTPPPDGGEPQHGAKDAAYWEAEAKKAFKVRDEVKAKLRDLEPRVLPEDELTELRRAKEVVSAAEEERKRKAGEFDALKTELTERHKRELLAAQKAVEEANLKATELQRSIEERQIAAEFAQASNWFGPSGKTVLAPEVARKFFGDYCKVENGQIVIVRPNGEVIHGRDGSPAPFGEAMAELIPSLPKHLQDSILRGSGKTGSGASGGSLGEGDDIPTLTAKVKAGVPGAAQALQRKLATTGGIVSGRAFTKA